MSILRISYQNFATFFLFLLLLTRLGRKFLNNIIRIFPSQGNVLGMASPRKDLTLGVAEVDGCKG